MSLPTITGTGQLLGDPKTGPTRTGGTWCNAVVKFQAWKKVDDVWTEGDTVVAAVITFDDDAGRILAGLRKGDIVTVTGTATVGLYREQAQLRVTADKVEVPERRPRADRVVDGAGKNSGADRPSSRRREEVTDRQWPRPAQVGAAPAQRGSGGVVANLKDHVQRRRNAS